MLSAFRLVQWTGHDDKIVFMMKSTARQALNMIDMEWLSRHSRKSGGQIVDGLDFGLVGGRVRL